MRKEEEKRLAMTLATLLPTEREKAQRVYQLLGRLMTDWLYTEVEAGRPKAKRVGERGGAVLPFDRDRRRTR